MGKKWEEDKRPHYLRQKFPWNFVGALILPIRYGRSDAGILTGTLPVYAKTVGAEITSRSVTSVCAYMEKHSPGAVHIATPKRSAASTV